MKYVKSFLGICLISGITGCTSDNSSSSQFTLYGSYSTTPVAWFNNPKANRMIAWFGELFLPVANAVPIGTPTSLKIKIYSISLSTNDDCTSPVEVLDNGVSGETVDLFTEPTLFSGSPAAGTYSCMILEVSDNMLFKPDAAAVAAEAAACVSTATEHTFDIYRNGEPDDGGWTDLSGVAIDGTGSIAAPGDDTVFIYASTDPAAVQAGAIGAHANQTLTLSGSLTAPGSATFYFDATNGIELNGANCWLETVTMGFR